MSPDGSNDHEPRSAGKAEAGDYQLVIVAGDAIRTFDLGGQGTVTIGRGEANTLRIDDPSVSRDHAILHVGAKLVIEDRKSNNGTIVREKASAGVAAETLNVRQIMGRTAEVSVGDTMVFGTVSTFVRHKPTVDLPDLTAGKPGVIVRDPGMKAVYEQAALAARTSISVLIFGETGVGKEVLARAIHAASPRSKGPFLGINCGALSETLLESELFGHEKGAFTGALQPRAGLFESADGGTVFLDEIGDVSQAMQVRLLRVLEERVVTRLGASRPRPFDVRFVAATNKDIEAESRAGRFRSDLFFRLNGLSFLIPPLRDRPQEIEPLARKFLEVACRQIEMKPPALATATLEALGRHDWPGNIRELRNAVDRAVALCTSDTILPEHLPSAVLKSSERRRETTNAANAATASAGSEAAKTPEDLQIEVKDLERRRIIEALDHCAGSQSEAARMLGLSRGTLIARIEEFKIPRPRKRDGGT